MSLKKIRLLNLCIALFCLSFVFAGCENSKEATGSSAEPKCRVGIAWRADTDSEFYTNIVRTVEEAGGEPILLDQVNTTSIPYKDGFVSSECISEHDYLDNKYAEILKNEKYNNSNAESVVADVDAVIFTGGEDISPTLYKQAEEWHGIESEKDYNATRDVSDYILMSYCIDNDIPVMGFCRGMQMLAVVSGGTMIQDIPTYFSDMNLEYNYEHRREKTTPDEYRDYTPHSIVLNDKNSLLYQIYGKDKIDGVPSWHHQAVKSVEGTNLKVTAITNVSGIDMIEAIERTDKTFMVGLQFHPEAAVVKNIDKAENADKFMDKASALEIFKCFMTYAQNNESESAA